MIAWSGYFNSYIKMFSYLNDNVWEFCLCDENGNEKSKPMYAKTKASHFKWKKIEGNN